MAHLSTVLDLGNHDDDVPSTTEEEMDALRHNELR
jgi:hypothetical protein